VAGRGGPPDLSEEQLVALRHRAKADLRKRLRAVRRALPASARAERSERIAAHVVALDPWRTAHTIAAYVAMGGEADPAPLVQAALRDGKRVVLPRVEPAAPDMTWHVLERDAPLEPSGMGFEQPRADAECIEPAGVDVVIVPAVAADERGHRIGMGRGYYDRALTSMTNATRIAIVYDFQLLAEVPDTPGDLPVHYVVSDRGALTSTGGQ
jgi:5-formyltetrahydrofolate cyclo-ligase